MKNLDPKIKEYIDGYIDLCIKELKKYELTGWVQLCLEDAKKELNDTYHMYFRKKTD